MLEVTIHGTITIDPQSEIKTIEDLICFMSNSTIHDVMKEIELCDNIKIIKIEETK